MFTTNIYTQTCISNTRGAPHFAHGGTAAAFLASVEVTVPAEPEEAAEAEADADAEIGSWFALCTHSGRAFAWRQYRITWPGF